jgi:hypothetical protein
LLTFSFETHTRRQPAAQTRAARTPEPHNIAAGGHSAGQFDG